MLLFIIVKNNVAMLIWVTNRFDMCLNKFDKEKYYSSFYDVIKQSSNHDVHIYNNLNNFILRK